MKMGKCLGERVKNQFSIFPGFFIAFYHSWHTKYEPEVSGRKRYFIFVFQLNLKPSYEDETTKKKVMKNSIYLHGKEQCEDENGVLRLETSISSD